MTFPDTAIASGQQDVRERLTTGSAVGPGGRYDERFEVASRGVQNTVLSLDLAPVGDRMSLASDLIDGPLLFAWCGG